MFKVISERAKNLLVSPRFIKNEILTGMKKFPSDSLNVWASLELEHGNVKNLSFFGELTQAQKIILESMAALLIGKNISRLGEMSVRECEAFLRDRNSQIAFEGLTDQDESEVKKFFNWLRLASPDKVIREYHFSLSKGPFRLLPLVDKVRELKAFFQSPEVVELYKNLTTPELVDIEELTVFVQAPYQTEADRNIFEELHLLGAQTFQEESLNFIPEA